MKSVLGFNDDRGQFRLGIKLNSKASLCIGCKLRQKCAFTTLKRSVNHCQARSVVHNEYGFLNGRSARVANHVDPTQSQLRVDRLWLLLSLPV